MAARRHVGITIDGLNPGANDQTKLALSKTVAPPPAMPALTTTDTTMPALTMTPATTRNAASSSTDVIACTTLTPAANTTPDNWAGVDIDWVTPEPDPSTYRTTTEYWKEKARLLEEAARRFRSFAVAVHSTLLTLRSSHPDWQPKYAEEPAEKGGQDGKRRIKGQWGDMDAIQMMVQLDQQVADEEAAAEKTQAKREDAEERKREREQLALEKKELKDATREFEAPLTRLLQRLHFIEENQEEASATQVAAFIKANRAVLIELKVDASSTVRKTVVPKLVPAIVQATSRHPWVAAPPKALPPPKEATPSTSDAALMLPPPPPLAATSPSGLRPPPTHDAAPHAAPDVSSSVESLADKQPAKRTRAGEAGEAGL